MDDFQTIDVALQSYKKDHGSYPASDWVSVNVMAQNSRRFWIPGLVPKYLPYVPTDPRGLLADNHQYMYRSDGVNFKLIAHGAEDSGDVALHHPELIDPLRKTYAYGMWTVGASGW